MSDKCPRYYAVRRGVPGAWDWWEGANPDNPDWGSAPYLDVDDTFARVIAERHGGEVVVFGPRLPDRILDLRGTISGLEAAIARKDRVIAALVERLRLAGDEAMPDVAAMAAANGLADRVRQKIRAWAEAEADRVRLC